MSGRNYQYPGPYKSRPLLNGEAARTLSRLRRGWRLLGMQDGARVWIVPPDGEGRYPVRRRTLDLLLDGCYVRAEGGRYVLWRSNQRTRRRTNA